MICCIFTQCAYKIPLLAMDWWNMTLKMTISTSFIDTQFTFGILHLSMDCWNMLLQIPFIICCICTQFACEIIHHLVMHLVCLNRIELFSLALGGSWYELSNSPHSPYQANESYWPTSQILLALSLQVLFIKLRVCSLVSFPVLTGNEWAKREMTLRGRLSVCYYFLPQGALACNC